MTLRVVLQRMVGLPAARQGTISQPTRIGILEDDEATVTLPDSAVGVGTDKVPLPLTRTEVVLKREHLDRLATFLREQKVWELSELAKNRIPNPDEAEIEKLIEVVIETAAKSPEK